MFIYIAVNPENKDKGIYVCTFDANKGSFSQPRCEIKGLGSLFTATDPKGIFLYAVGSNEKGEGVFAFSISKETGQLKFLNHAASGGALPCHITIDKLGRYAFVANYGGGSIAAFPIEEDGCLSEASCIIKHNGSGENSTRQEAPHPHCITLDNTNRFVFATDLGIDKIMIYRLDSDNGKLSPHFPAFASLQSGCGPRHFIFHPLGRHGFSINELSNTITVFQYDAASGILTEVQTISTIPANWAGRTYASEIQIHPCGKYIYGANRGHDSIAVFGFGQKEGKVNLIEIQPCGGCWPDHFCIDPTGNWLLCANRKSNSIALFRIDAATGRLIATGNVLEVPSPSSIQFFGT